MIDEPNTNEEGGNEDDPQNPEDDAKRNPDAQIATTACRNQRIYASKTQQLQTERRLKKTTP